MVNLKDVDVFTLINDKNVATYKEISEVLFSLDMNAKRKLDAGVSPSEFDKLEALRTSVQYAQDILNELNK